MIRQFQLRFAMLFASLLIVAGAALPSSAYAQDDRCRCNYVTINVDLGVQCKVTVCALTPDGTKNCIVIAPGTRDRLPCVPGTTYYIRDCHGLVPLNPVPGNCDLGIGAGPNCCTVDACYSLDANGCIVISIRPSILDVCPCL